ncbi:AraC family transcriptional regulator [Sphingobacterium sp. BS-2]|uniref:AraC family transcriptional regulator n=1 Tax=Sphingobacterium sp. BS-2 TaxID=3377129 RepID=UPI0038FCF63A
MAKEKSNIINEYHLNRHKPDSPQFALYDLKTHLMENRCQVIRPHIHSFYQIIWFKKGKGKHSVDFKTYNVFDNSIFFVGPNQVHHFDENNDYEGVLFHFNRLFILQDQSPLDFFLHFNLFNNSYHQSPFILGKGIIETLDRYVSQIKDELNDVETFGKELILGSYLKSFLIQVQRKTKNSELTSEVWPPTFNDKRLLITRFVNLIDENYRKGYTIAEYASSLHISSRSLSDLTQQQLNKTPSQMVQERIILEAQRLLLYSHSNINQVAYRLGFEDASYFVKYFKKYTGVSPKEFRKSIS